MVEVYAPIPKKATWPKENIAAYPPRMFHATPIMAKRNTMIMTCVGNVPLTTRGKARSAARSAA